MTTRDPVVERIEAMTLEIADSTDGPDAIPGEAVLALAIVLVRILDRIDDPILRRMVGECVTLEHGVERVAQVADLTTYCTEPETVPEPMPWLPVTVQ
jgi:hypothetical protein